MLAFGILGYGMMLFAGLLGARKKVPVWRIGRAQTWMRGHLWLGFLSFPMILFHAGFAARGPLTAVLMALMFIVVLSGIVVTTLVGSGGLLPPDTTGAASTKGRGESEVDVLLGVETNHERGNVDDLLADAVVVVGFCFVLVVMMWRGGERVVVV